MGVYRVEVIFLINLAIIVLIVLVLRINKIFTKYNNKIMLKISKIIITFILIMIFIGINEHWIHSHDERGLLENKLAVPLLITGFFPLLDNNLNFDNIEIKLPYGYRKVNEYSAITIIGSPSKIYRELDNRFDFVDQLGSSMVWVDKNNDKLIFINEVQRGGIRYLFMNTKN